MYYVYHTHSGGIFNLRDSYSDLSNFRTEMSSQVFIKISMEGIGFQKKNTVIISNEGFS